MNKQCLTSEGSKAWTREEMMAYLDWSRAENDGIESKVLTELGAHPTDTGRGGLHYA